eukprot:2835922-Lingulodinium_polyedra.AAC.1
MLNGYNNSADLLSEQATSHLRPRWKHCEHLRGNERHTPMQAEKRIANRSFAWRVHCLSRTIFGTYSTNYPVA